MAGADLRPLTLGETLDVAFGLYRSLFLPLLMVTVVTRALPFAVSGYVQASGGLVANLPLYFLSLVMDMVLAAIATAASTFIVSESYMGRRLPAREAFRRAGSFIGRLITLGILSSLAIMLGLLMVVVPGIMFACGLVLATPALVIESLPSATAAMQRSWSLSRGFRWKIFGALFVVLLLMYLPFLALGGVGALSLGAGAAEQLGFWGFTLAAALISSLIWPLFYCVLTVTYYDLRVRKEAFDLEHLAAGLAQA